MAGSSVSVESSDDDPPPLSSGESLTPDSSPDEKSDAGLITANNSVVEMLELQATVDEDLGEKFEEILTEIGGFGKYQKLVIFLVVLPAIFANGLLGSSWLFMVNTPKNYWCNGPELFGIISENGTKHDELREKLLPRPTPGANSRSCGGGDATVTSQCCMYDINYGNLSATGYTGAEHISDYFNASGGKNRNLTLMACTNGWSYDKSFLKSSIVTDFHLVCDLDFLPTLGYMIPTVGGVAGIIAGGYLSDKQGRKRAFFVFLLLVIIFGPTIALSSNFNMFVVLSTLASLPSSPLYSIPYTLAMEITSPNMRVTCSVLMTVAFTMGGIALVGIAKFFPYWKTILLASTLPYVAFLAYWKLMPESPRWLLSQSRFKELQRYLKMIAKFNGRVFTLDTEEKIQKLKVLQQHSRRVAVSTKTSFLDLFRSKSVLKKIVVLSYLSFCLSSVYVGLYFYAPMLGSNPFLNLLLSSLIELPSSLLTEVVASGFGRWPGLGRRWTLLSCLVLGVVSMLGTAGVPSPDTHYGTLLLLFCSARLFMTSAYTVQELMVYECFPTAIRGEAVSFITLFAYVVSCFGPLVVYFKSGDFTMPFMIFGGMSLAAIFCVLVLPDTAGPLSESFDESDKPGRRKNWRELFLVLPLRQQRKKRVIEIRATDVT